MATRRSKRAATRMNQGARWRAIGRTKSTKMINSYLKNYWMVGRK
jgi:hypothetical protein